MIRPRESDMFALGTREAVVAALAGDGSAFGAPALADDVVAALARLGIDAVTDAGGVRAAVDDDPVQSLRIEIIALVHGWIVEAGDADVVLRARSDSA